MKKIITYCIISFLCVCVYAQDSIIVHNGTNMQKFLLTDIDSIVHTGNNVNIFHNFQRTGLSIFDVDSITLKNGAPKETEEIMITNIIDWNAIHGVKDNYRLVSLQQDIVLSEETTSVITPAIKNNTSQIMLLLNANDEIVMMSKGFYDNGDINTINSHSTAIALVTMHPIFGYILSDDYDVLVQLITSSSYFETLEAKIGASIENGVSLFSDNDVLSAFSTLMEDLTSTDLDNSDSALDVLQTRAQQNRVLDIGSLTNIGPFEMELRDGFLLVYPRCNTPFYEGTVTSVYGVESLNIKQGDGMGILSALVQPTGHQILYNFNNKPEGEYNFHFDRTTPAACANFYIHFLGDVLDIIGLPLSLTKEFGLVAEINYRSAQLELANAEQNVGQIIEITISAILSYSQTPAFQNWMIRNGIRESARTYIQRAVPIVNWYQAIRGSANAIARTTLWLNSPPIIDFRLCHNDETVSACTEVKIEKSGGDNQEGYKGERLLNALEVMVLTYADDGTLIEDRNNYYRVKYSVESGGGHLSWDEANVSYGYATTYWWLGHEDIEQKVRACVIDIATGQEISEPVYFTANVSEKTNITFRLDWDRTLTNTDIDLHVECPKGHHIFYQSMSCPCGGQLDRDDRQGPGPEHIRFNNAEPGDYIVYVHHYESESQATIGFTLTTSTNEQTYRNAGSVSYHRYSPKYKLTIPSNISNARRRGSEFIIEEIDGEIGNMLDLPPKE